LQTAQKRQLKNKFAYLGAEESENCIKFLPGQMSESDSQKGAAKSFLAKQEMHFKAFGNSQCLPN